MVTLATPTSSTVAVVSLPTASPPSLIRMLEHPDSINANTVMIRNFMAAFRLSALALVSNRPGSQEIFTGPAALRLRSGRAPSLSRCRSVSFAMLRARAGFTSDMLTGGCLYCPIPRSLVRFSRPPRVTRKNLLALSPSSGRFAFRSPALPQIFLLPRAAELLACPHPPRPQGLAQLIKASAQKLTP